VLTRARPGDLAVAVFFAAVAVLESFDTAIDDGTRQGLPWVNAVFGVLLCLPVLVRGRRPVTAYVSMVVLLAVPTSLVPHEVFSLGGLPPVLLVTWSFARHRDGWTARWCWVPPAVLPTLTWSDAHGSQGLGDLGFRLVFVGGAVLVGRTMRRFTVQSAELRRVLHALEAQQEARRDAAVQQERTRIAAEMHDVVAHAVSAMVVQVGAARMEGGPEAELDKLRSAEVTGHRALEELRAILGLLRSDAGPDRELRPLPGLDGTADLARSLEAAGFEVDLQVPSVHLPESLALATYRVLQEAFTNALKHGARGRVVACVAVEEGHVSLRVESPLRGGRAALPSRPRVGLPPGGHGLVGMRERVALFGGELEAGAQGERYVVAATMRLTAEPVTV
jgi:signal transduction histidine kinase